MGDLISLQDRRRKPPPGPSRNRLLFEEPAILVPLTTYQRYLIAQALETAIGTWARENAMDDAGVFEATALIDQLREINESEDEEA